MRQATDESLSQIAGTTTGVGRVEVSAGGGLAQDAARLDNRRRRDYRCRLPPGLAVERRGSSTAHRVRGTRVRSPAADVDDAASERVRVQAVIERTGSDADGLNVDLDVFQLSPVPIRGQDREPEAERKCEASAVAKRQPEFLRVRT
jgi:hypothetical protein